MAFSNDDIWNVIEQHIVEALQADAKLGTGGALEIATWEQELREDVGTYQSNQLPAVGVEVIGQSAPDVIGIGDTVDYTYQAIVVIATTGGTLATVKADTKYYGSRAVRVLQQQHYPDKQLNNVTAAIGSAETGTVLVVVTNVDYGAGIAESSNALRGLIEISASVRISLTISED